MEEEVIIKITGRQEFIHNGEKDKIEQVVTGRLFLKNDKYYLIYNDNSPGVDGAEAKLRIDLKAEQLLLMRDDPAPLKQKFIEGEITDGYYGRVEQKFDISVDTEKISLQADMNSGEINVDYCLYFNRELTSENKLSIRYRTDN
ncbi:MULTISPECIES: DUF1934 domain-containing protein [unclassified Halanaerobium]|uniref:DUF1934 domain-containing protein n=1 Tax=unclassified Halanaerobium TaxID=2641197 RepID=UPI000DF4B9E6|nr:MULTISPECIES: DUF1934 domain-containing protein [unclassified Halanaerobium]RCW48284.1 uncharacterized beta-barrel protein YwiB (DUF1934 family) [Halanaerobium sp. MA284_MarDTE_T2]RCW85711.1 uncharacterized beta-barrel protein YwiB (DUF1934 family) [Halanaerobium sp. DL-01]